jgi:hypothetical protein
VYRLIELVAYHYQEVTSAVLEATMEGIEVKCAKGEAVCGLVIDRK